MMLRTTLLLAGAAAWLAACGSDEPQPAVENQLENEVETGAPAEPPAEPPSEAPAPAPDDQAPEPPVGEGPPPADEDPPADEAPPADEDPPADGEAGGGAERAIPAAFHGEWNSDRAACGSPSETRLIVNGNRLRFHESVARVRRVVSVNDRTLRVTAVYRGEGERRTETRRLRLSPNGNRLTVSGAGSSLTRFRCG